MHVVATAGHVDHGKSTLVHALTGVDPDRFEEEKRRGLTIDLGFAWTTLPSGAGVAFVDVPGHVRFLKNMLAGVGAVDACVFVVAATEGWKPQSEEHLRILELLGIRHGLVAITKVGLVDDDDRELARLDIADHVKGTFLEGAETVAVDPPTGVGMGELRLALDRLLADTPVADDRNRPRLWIDRSFSAPGAGTVVTGTLTGGTIHHDDELIVVTPRGQRPVRVRGIQSQNRAHQALPPGNRAAFNLVGVHHDEVARGDAVVRPGQWHLTRMVDASLTVLAAVGHEITRRGAYAVYLGSGEHPVRLRVLQRDAIVPGDEGLVRLHLPVAVPLLPGDRFVLRESGRGETVGGGEILDVSPVLPAARARPDRAVDRVIAERGWIDVEELARLTGERRPPTAGRWVVDPAALEALTAEVQRRIDEAGDLGLDVATLDDRDRAVLDRCEVAISQGRATRPKAGEDPLSAHWYVAELHAHPFDPPTPAEADVERGELRELIRRGLVVEQDGVCFAPSAVDDAARRVAQLLAGKPEGLTVGDVRAVLGTSRKWAVPLLTRLDATGVTRRRGDVRIAGPRLPAADP